MFVLPDYNLTLGDVITQHLSKDDAKIQSWIYRVGGQTISGNMLVYRHYLIDAVLSAEIFPNREYRSLYILMASMCYKDVNFAKLDDTAIWERLEEQTLLINTLRQTRPIIRDSVHQLADRMDITDHRLAMDHAMLSSHSLLYGLYLTHVILTFEQTVRPHETIEEILLSLTATLKLTKGVLFHV